MGKRPLEAAEALNAAANPLALKRNRRRSCAGIARSTAMNKEAGRVRHMMRGIALVMVLLAVNGCLAGSEDAATGKIQWVSSLAEGLKLAKESGKPIMLFFTADWCGPCVELKKYIFTDKRVVAASTRLINVAIDADRDYETLTAYKVRGIPAVFFLDPLGDTVSKYNGDRSAGSFVKEMKALADKYSR